jgi:hypothetical protein
MEIQKKQGGEAMNFKDVFHFRFMWDLSEFAEYLLIVLALGACLFAYKTLVKIFEEKKGKGGKRNV